MTTRRKCLEAGYKGFLEYQYKVLHQPREAWSAEIRELEMWFLEQIGKEMDSNGDIR